MGSRTGAAPQAPEPSVVDPNLQVRKVVEGLTTPSTVAFLGRNDMLVLEKNTGKVLRVVDGAVQSTVLDLSVNFASERGLLGIAPSPARSAGTSSASSRSACATASGWRPIRCPGTCVPTEHRRCLRRAGAAGAGHEQRLDPDHGAAAADPSVQGDRDDSAPVGRDPGRDAPADPLSSGEHRPIPARPPRACSQAPATAIPEFSWKFAVPPGGVGFVRGRRLGRELEGDLFVGGATANTAGGHLFRFDLSGNRRGLDLRDPRLADRVADNTAKHDITESESLLIGRDFGVLTDIETGPNGNLFVVSLSRGAIYEISRR